MYRIGDRVCPRYHMSKVGTVIDMRQQAVTAGNGAGAFSKMWIIVFVTDDGEELTMKAQDIMKAD
jgi:hypothetical protein